MKRDTLMFPVYTHTRTAPAESDDCFLMPSQAAKLLNISLSTLKKFIYSGRVKTFKTPGGHHRIRKSDLLNHSRSGKAAGPRLTPEIIALSEAFLNMAGLRQKFSRKHAEEVAALSERIAEHMGMSSERAQVLHFAARVHDIGMCAIDETILNKTTGLTHSEYRAVKMHPVLGGMMFASLKDCAGIAKMISQHHEHWDGSGYPSGLKAGQICLEARIIAVAESFASMTEQDTYNHKMPVADAREEIISKAGTYYDPEVVAAFEAATRIKDKG